MFIFVGLNTQWKQVVTYHHTGWSLDGIILNDFNLRLVSYYFEIELKVWVLTSDIGGAISAMWRGLVSVAEGAVTRHVVFTNYALLNAAFFSWQMLPICLRMFETDFCTLLPSLRRNAAFKNGFPTVILEREYVHT